MRIAQKTVQVRIGESLHTLCVPADPEGDMQRSWEVHGEEDSYFPFWLEAWPSSFGLFDFLSRNQVNLHGAVELGCGCGTLAQLLVSSPGILLHTDLVPAACSFLKRQLVHSGNRHVFAMDMTKPCLAEAPHLVLGADLFYEYRLVEYACAFVQGHMHPEGTAYFADPMRPSRPEVPAKIADTGVLAEKILWDYTLNGESKKLAIWKLTRR